MSDLKSLVAKYMKEAANNINAGTSDITESQAMDILRVVAHERMSKEQACIYLNLSRSRFDDLVREKKLPKGKKEVGWKELSWFRDELDTAVRKLKNK